MNDANEEAYLEWYKKQRGTQANESENNNIQEEEQEEDNEASIPTNNKDEDTSGLLDLNELSYLLTEKASVTETQTKVSVSLDFSL